MRDLMELSVVNTEAITLRSVAGEGGQLELIVKSRHGSLHLRLLPSGHRVIRLSDLRARDRRRVRRTRLLSVPFSSREP